MSNHKYPTLYEMYTNGLKLTYDKMRHIILAHWGDSWPSDDWYALEEALKETMK